MENHTLGLAEKYSNLIKTLSEATADIAAIPENAEVSMSDTDALDELRLHSLKLLYELEAFMNVFRGQPG